MYSGRVPNGVTVENGKVRVVGTVKGLGEVAGEVSLSDLSGGKGKTMPAPTDDGRPMVDVKLDKSKATTSQPAK